MGFTRYVKERWLLYVFLAAGFLFSFVVYKLDRNFNITPSNASYIVLGWRFYWYPLFVPIMQY